MIAEPSPDFDLDRPLGRVRTYADYLWNDHAYLRLAFSNAHRVSDELVRANQPWPHQLEAWKARGVRTVINLRGDFHRSFYALEREACRRFGLELVNFPMGSREVPSRERVLGARRLFETVRYPALMHCKSGADRAGLMSVLYLHFRKGATIREAMDQLHLRYLHVRQGKTGVLDYTFERYLAEGEPAGMSFLEWVRSPAYDPAGFRADFKAQMWGSLVSERLLNRE
ncbi:MAG TPA: sulfur transferase domain-containing protein [Phenylobacterium sp.]|uniref:fused DSP-PTPase phosphatase/NAD kinase-like protein n=1 Tax=Phenylobacterium sp. TaxID=1871053 RepID=UPI002CB601E9|nr:sulfur transferase domain-containing protein [Phenylobacterium sp.]HSV02068.1 sulfur transferase domain-containing protein [Phenylobacterium sp.]